MNRGGARPKGPYKCIDGCCTLRELCDCPCAILPSKVRVPEAIVSLFVSDQTEGIRKASRAKSPGARGFRQSLGGAPTQRHTCANRRTFAEELRCEPRHKLMFHVEYCLDAIIPTIGRGYVDMNKVCNTTLSNASRCIAVHG